MEKIQHYLERVHDFRRDQGKRYKLSSILLLVILGYMSGCTSLYQVYIFGNNLNKKDRLRLGFDKKMPSHPTTTETMKKVAAETLEATLSAIVSKRISNFTQIAVDGKSIRGTSKTKEGLIHLMP